VTVGNECGAVDALDNRKKHDSLAAKRTVCESERTAEGERRSNPSLGRAGAPRTGSSQSSLEAFTRQKNAP
jgi:hypothetical protein